MLKQILLIPLLLSFLTSMQAQDRVSLFTYWNKGDVQKLLVTEGYIEYEDDKIVKKEVDKSTVVITVKNETDTSYLMEWLWTESEVDRLNVAVDEEDAELDSQIEDMFTDIPVLFEIDESGNYKHLVNYDEIMEISKEALGKLMKEEMTEEDSEEDLEMMMELLFESDLMRDQLEREIYNYHYYMANTFPTDTTMNYEEEIENKIGGKDLPAKGVVKIFLTEEDQGLHIYDTKTIATDGVKESVMKLGALIEDESIKDSLEMAFEERELSLKDIENYIYNFETGWLKLYEQMRVISSESKRRESFLRMEAIE